MFLEYQITIRVISERSCDTEDSNGNKLHIKILKKIFFFYCNTEFVFIFIRLFMIEYMQP